MKVDEKLRSSAEDMVKRLANSERFNPVQDFPGMYVTLATEDGIQAMAFFSVDGLRYAIGPKRKDLIE